MEKYSYRHNGLKRGGSEDDDGREDAQGVRE